MNIVIPMAGAGSRFSSSHPGQLKPLIDVKGRPMIERVIQNLGNLNKTKLTIITSSNIGTNIQFKKILLNSKTDHEIVLVDELTDGPACTCLLVKNKINNDEPLIILNCDQIIADFSLKNLLNFAKINKADGVIGTFHSNSKKNSYLRLSGNLDVQEVKEKIVISNIATNGIHFWTNGRDFVESAVEMIAHGEKYCNEYYVAPTYNYMIQKGKKILPYYYNLHYPIGTPEDLKYFEECVYGNL
jgi:dTDP-glucose pyrophosphorylase